MSTIYKNRSCELNECQCISFTEQMFQLTLLTPKYGASGKYDMSNMRIHAIKVNILMQCH